MKRPDSLPAMRFIVKVTTELSQDEMFPCYSSQNKKSAHSAKKKRKNLVVKQQFLHFKLLKCFKV